MKVLKKLVVLVLVNIVVLQSAVLCVDAEETNYNINIGLESDYGLLFDGYEPNLPTPSENESHTTLTSYDPRITNSVTNIGNQSCNGVCWAFASTAIFESAVLKNTGLKCDYSEQALRYLTSNKVKEKIGNNSDIGNYNRGSQGAGSVISGMSYYTRANSPVSNQINWVSPNFESDVPYTLSDENAEYMLTVNHLFDQYGLPLGIDTSVTNAYATNTIYIDFDYVKDYILEYGAVYFTFCASNLNNDTNSFYSSSINAKRAHAVAVVGWDDNYSKYNFSENMRPDNDGAWLIKNSWGINDKRPNDDGYYWVSYDDPSVNIHKGCAVVTDVAPVSKNEYMLSYDYTPMAKHCEHEITQSSSSVYMANVYDVSELSNLYGSINKVMFYSNDIGAFYQVYVIPMTSASNFPPNVSSLGSAKAYGTVNYEGYITEEFTTPVSFGNNTDKIAVIIKFTKDYNESDGILLTQEITDSNYNAISFSGESFYLNQKDGNTWIDVTGNNEISNNGNFCIRPTLVRRMPITQNSTLSSNNLIYSGSDVTVNLNLNGNLLYRITENGNTILFEDNQFTRTEDSVTFKNSYLSSLGVNQYKNIIFEFTDGNSQTLRITRKSNLPNVSIGGKFAVGQTVRAVFDDTDATSGIAYQWQSSPDGTTWADITNATSSTYTIDNSNLLNYLRVKIKSQGNSSYVFPQEKLSSVSTNKVVMYGDVNFDGRINVNDATLIQKYAADLVNFNAEQMVAADVDGDGCISVNDANLINKFSMGLIEVFPVENS